MGIGSTVKNMLGNDNASNEAVREERTSFSNNLDSPTTTSRTAKLPAGTGPGTSGKGVAASTEQNAASMRASDMAVQRDAAYAQGSNSIAGHGTDAAAAAGGSMAGTHQGFNNLTTRSSGRTSDAGTGVKKSRSASGNASSSGTSGVKRATKDLADTSGISASGQVPPPVRDVRDDRVGDLDTLSERFSTDLELGDRGHNTQSQSGVLSSNHIFGHNKNNVKDSMPGDNAQEDTKQLQPVTHERVRHLETEEVGRVKELERHIHHIQHHTQPVVASEELAEQLRENIHPVTVINEKHANKVEDNTLFEGQVHQYRDTLVHGAKERTIVDKGTTVNEHVHHHVHHVIQPVIEKETIDKTRIRTTIPIREIWHEAPVVHQSQTHAPVPIEHFLQRGGTLDGAISRDEISNKVLHNGQCVRQVDGIAETLERDLNLGKSGHAHDVVSESDELHSKKTSRHAAGAVPVVAAARN